MLALQTLQIRQSTLVFRGEQMVDFLLELECFTIGLLKNKASVKLTTAAYAAILRAMRSLVPNHRLQPGQLAATVESGWDYIRVSTFCTHTPLCQARCVSTFTASLGSAVISRHISAAVGADQTFICCAQEPVFQRKIKINEKLKLLNSLKGSNAYCPKTDKHLAKTLLFIAEHQMRGMKNNAGGTSHAWERPISVEPILPMALDPRTGGWEQAGWTSESHKGAVHKLGNLCLVAGPEDWASSNLDFAAKRAKLLEPLISEDHTAEDAQTAAETSRMLIGEEAWTPDAYWARHETLISHFAQRWHIRVSRCLLPALMLIP